MTKLLILFLCFNQIYGNKFCEQKKFDAIHTHEIFTEGKDTYSSAQIIINDQLFKWSLQTNRISEPLIWKEITVLVRIFIGVLPVCERSGGDCEELYKLSEKAITFSRNVNKYSYKITRFLKNHNEVDCNDCELPWNMSAKGDSLSVHRLWPLNWVKKPEAAYDPHMNQLVFVINPTGHLDSTKIIRNSLKSHDWDNTWITDELKHRYSFISLVTLMAVNGTTGQPIRQNMNKVFAFRLLEGKLHEVYEYNSHGFTKSDYTYGSLFNCTKVKAKDSNLIFYVSIAVLITIIVIILIIVGFVGYLKGKKTKGSSHFQNKSSSTADAKSSGSYTRRSTSSSQ